MIPKIIHQIWEGRTEPLPDAWQQLGETWKNCHSDWQYMLWVGNRMEAFITENYPDFEAIYSNYQYNVQRWDAIRYLILYKMGGLYADFDYECLDAFDDYITNDGRCYFSMEPEAHCRAFGKDLYFNNALMITPPNHPFFEHIIKRLIETPVQYTGNKFHDVLTSTGPLMLTALYEGFSNKSLVNLLPAELVSPWSKMDVQNYASDGADEGALEKKLEKAIAIHYFGGSWVF